MANALKGLKECELSEILFPVEVRNTPMWSNNENSKVVIGKVNGKRKLLNCCSPVYKLIANELIFPVVEQLLREANISFETSYYEVGNVRFYAKIVITDAKYGFKIKGTNDVIQPMLTVQHSYNGKTKFKILFGYFRLICSNGLTIPLAEMEQYNLVIEGKHTENIATAMSMLNDMIIKFSTDADMISTAIGSKFNVLANNVPANVTDRITNVLKAVGITAIESSKFNTVEYVQGLAQYEANLPQFEYDGVINDWLIYNAINQLIMDDDLNIMFPEIRREKDSKVMEYMLRG